MALVRPRSPFLHNGADGTERHYAPSDVLDESDPIVVALPEMFVPIVVTFRSVEQATAAPGEKRSTRR